MKSPPRGEVWLVDLGLAAKVRPALIVSVPTQDPERSLVSLIPHTTSIRGGRFEVQFAVRFLKPGAFDVQAIVTVPLARLVRRMGVLSVEQLSQVEAVAQQWLAMKSEV